MPKMQKVKKLKHNRNISGLKKISLETFLHTPNPHATLISPDLTNLSDKSSHKILEILRGGPFFRISHVQKMVTIFFECIQFKYAKNL